MNSGVPQQERNSYQLRITFLLLFGTTNVYHCELSAKIPPPSSCTLARAWCCGQAHVL